MRRFAALLLPVICYCTSAAHAAPRDAESWVALTVAPALVRELSSHPRFNGETVRVVVFEDDQPAASSNVFAISLRDRLARAIFDTPGIRMAADDAAGPRLDCTLGDVDYYIGLQIAYLGRDEYRIDLRTLDLTDRTWVTGFDLTWQGQFSQSQLQEYEASAPDPWFRGARAAPFEEGHADLLASKVARELACKSLRQTAGEYVVLLETDPDDAMSYATELVGNNLAAMAPLKFTSDPARANASLRGQTHAVDGGLSQFWAIIAPLDSSSDLPTLNANAYVQIAQVAADPLESLLSRNTVLSPAVIVDGEGQGTAMRVKAIEDAVVFFLNHQQRYGLVRLASRDCESQPDARVLRSNESFDRALPVSAMNADAASAADGWSLEPEGDVYYAVAVSDSTAAYVLARHIRKLPQRCTSAARFGLRGKELETWLTDFADIVDDQRDHVDWQAIQVRNIY